MVLADFTDLSCLLVSTLPASRSPSEALLARIKGVTRSWSLLDRLTKQCLTGSSTRDQQQFRQIKFIKQLAVALGDRAQPSCRLWLCSATGPNGRSLPRHGQGSQDKLEPTHGKDMGYEPQATADRNLRQVTVGNSLKNPPGIQKRPAISTYSPEDRVVCRFRQEQITRAKTHHLFGCLVWGNVILDKFLPVGGVYCVRDRCAATTGLRRTPAPGHLNCKT